MYEQGVRTRVIERIMGWSPRQMHERHYLRVADEAMHDAIQTLYRDDPICERQARPLRPVELPHEAKPAADCLASETARIAELEQRLGIGAS
jgi:hypothetical protein